MDETIRKILLIEDSRGDAELIQRMALDFGRNYIFRTSTRLSTGLKLLSEDAYDIVLLDLGLPDSSGIDTLLKLQKEEPALPVIVLTGLADEELAAKAIQFGAQDYLPKGQLDGRLLVRSIGYAIERKKAAQALRASERQFAAFMLHLPAAAWIKDLHGRYVFVNAEAERIFSTPLGPVLQKTDSDIFPPETARRFAENDRRTLLQGGSLQTTEILRQADGVDHYSIVSKFVLPGPDGRPAHIAGVAFDITERRKAEASLRESEERYRIIAETAQDAMITIDEESRIMLVNPATETIFGYKSEDLYGKQLTMLMPERFRQAHLDGVRRRVAGGKRPLASGGFERLGLHRDGSEVPLEITYGQFSKEGGQFFIGIVRDVAERKRAGRALQESRERFRSLVEATSDWVWEVDENGVYIYVSPQVRVLLGYEPEEVLGRTPFDLMPEEEARRVAGIFRNITSSQKPFSLLEKVNLTKEGNRIVLETSGVPFFDASGVFRGYRGIDRDVTGRKRAEETIKYQAYHDLLTGLPNRALFTDLVNREMPQMQRIHKKLAVLFLDIDRFKTINDSLGHDAGDALILDIAVRLKDCIRESDAAARIGGDKFTLLLPLLTSPGDAARIAEKIMEVFEQAFRIKDHELRITASIGISIYPDDGDNAEALLKYADIAMYHAKDQGRSNYQFFNAAQNIRTLEHVMLENRLRQAIEHGELIIQYQPQVNIQTGKIVGAEALVRWQHPELGLLGPEQFIPLAEEIGLIVKIDQWVLHAVCAQVKAWQAAGEAPPFVAINLSARQFQRPNLDEVIANVLKESALSPEALRIEITETIAMRDTELTSLNLRRLSAMGIRFSIDDFGTGYSSLSYLKKLPIHKLKIDKSFITNLGADPDDRVIIQAIIAMAHSLKLEVVAEGVETDEQIAFLRSQGCDEIQGYLFSGPVKPERLGELVSAEAAA